MSGVFFGLWMISLALAANAQDGSRFLKEGSKCEVRVHLQEGWVCGVHRVAENRTNFASFLGLPYAEQPVGVRRFSELGPVEPWDCLYDASYEGPACPQHNAFYGPLLGSTNMSEACIYANVHVPLYALPEYKVLRPERHLQPPHETGVADGTDTGLPILVFIHGGGFAFGSGSTGLYGPEYLMSKDMIVITFNYRLGPAGFLCSNEDKIPGNAGLKDVLMALRWVRDNIVAFYGNPNKVVIAGQSFGAAMVEALVVTSSAKGLFHGAILQSGTVMAPWAFNFDAEERAMFLRMQFNASRAITTLAKAGVADMANKAEELNLPYFSFGICMENSLKNEEMIISKPPMDLISKSSSNVPIMIGYTNNEAYVFSSMLKDKKVVKKMSHETDFLIPIELQTGKREILQMMKKMKEMYFEDNMTMPSVLSYHRDAYFLSHIYRSLRLHASFGRLVYHYQFSYVGNVGVDEELDIPKLGAAHSDELAYLFPDKGRNLNGDDGIVQNHLINIWSNFVKYLNPSGANKQIMWEPVNIHDPKVLDINMELDFIDFPYKKEAQMWEDIYDKYYFERRRI